MKKETQKNSIVKKIWVSDEVKDFIMNYNCISLNSKKYNSTSNVYWNDCKYIETEDPNVFEIVFDTDIISEFIDNRRRQLDEEKNNS